MRLLRSLAVAAALVAAVPLAGQERDDGVVAASAAQLPPAVERGRWTAEEARQGVAVDERYFYAISNNAIGKYDKKSGQRVAHWEGERRLYPHMNSCVADHGQLICAASNHPGVPMASAVEFFDTATLRHVRTVALPPVSGSLTWIEPHGDGWFAAFANYDEGHGGEPGHDHRWSLLVQMDEHFRILNSWHFPADILASFAPMSCSGGSWGDDGLLYVTGHDRAEMYVLRLPEAGTVVEHVATIPLPTGGQAFAWDRAAPRRVWTIDRKTRSVVTSDLPRLR
jgi:hypothetical protein